MDIKVVLDIVAIVISVLAIILSFYAATKGNRIAEVANELVETSNKISGIANSTQMAGLELDIRNSILIAKHRYEDISLKINGICDDGESGEILGQVEKSALESYLTAYDDACGKYIDGKVDVERFKKTYFDEIRNIVTSDTTKQYFVTPGNSYYAVLRVYDEWFNREREK